MGTHITILELVVISGLSILGYVIAKTIYETWFKK